MCGPSTVTVGLHENCDIGRSSKKTLGINVIRPTLKGLRFPIPLPHRKKKKLIAWRTANRPGNPKYLPESDQRFG